MQRLPQSSQSKRPYPSVDFQINDVQNQTSSPISNLLVNRYSQANYEWMPVEASRIEELAANNSSFDIDYFSVTGKLDTLLNNSTLFDLIGSSSMATIYKK